MAEKKGTATAAESDLLDSGSGDWNVKGKGKEKEKENAAGRYTGYDSHGGAHDRYQTPSVTSSSPSLEIITNRLERPERSGFARPRRNPGFAKPLPGPPASRHVEMIEELKAAATGRTVRYSDDEEEDSDEEWGTL
ncbi:MAG: hypothetical protein Q9182_005154 [Xanthomendoza sp. 2 TL-2023]